MQLFIKDIILYITLILVLAIGIYLLICRPNCSNKDHFTNLKLRSNGDPSPTGSTYFLIADANGNITTINTSTIPSSADISKINSDINTLQTTGVKLSTDYDFIYDGTGKFKIVQPQPS